MRLCALADLSGGWQPDGRVRVRKGSNSGLRPGAQGTQVATTRRTQGAATSRPQTWCRRVGRFAGGGCCHRACATALLSGKEITEDSIRACVSLCRACVRQTRLPALLLQGDLTSHRTDNTTWPGILCLHLPATGPGGRTQTKGYHVNTETGHKVTLQVSRTRVPDIRTPLESGVMSVLSTPARQRLSRRDCRTADRAAL